MILQVAPTTTEDRLKRITEAASGFIYVMNVEDVTGVRESLRDYSLRIIERVRRYTDIPILVGFGISNREQVETVISAGADGIIAGSVFARIYEGNLENPEIALPEITRLVKEMKYASSLGLNSRLSQTR